MINKSVLVYDSGFFVSLAESLVGQFENVYYFSPWETGYSRSQSLMIGSGIKGVERVKYFWEVVPEIDLFIFTDYCFNDIQEELKRQDKLVWGFGKTSWMEADRVRFRQWQDKVGMNTPEWEEFIGIDALRKGVKPESYIKISDFRQDMETLKHYSDECSEQFYDELSVKLGAGKSEMQFISEEKVNGDTIEPGYDTWTINGKSPQKYITGYEIKDEAFCGKWTEFMPKPFAEIKNELDKVFAKEATIGFYSTEIMMPDAKTGFLLDFTARCFDDKTEILTDKGWKLFKNLDRTESVATLNPDNYNIEYHKPYAYQVMEHDGEMVHIKSREKKIDLLVTPDHSMWVRKRNEGKLVNMRADKLYGRLTIPRTGIWDGENQMLFRLPDYRNSWLSGRYMKIKKDIYCPPVNVDMVTWLKFLGYYLSEGSINTSYQINIAQTKHKQKMYDELKGMPFDVKITDKGLLIYSIQLSEYCRQFGLCSDKFVPDFIKNLSPELIKIFVEAYVLGDGSDHKGQWVIHTTSKRIADDMQELFLKMGDVAIITKDATKGTKMSVNGGKEYIRNHDIYHIRQCTIRKDCYYEGSTRKRSGKVGAGAYSVKEHYEGLVYDLTVKNHIIYVRRNGIPCWSGNCGNPPFQLYITMIENLAEILWLGAQGIVIEPKLKFDWGAIAIINSDFASRNWMPLQINTKVAKFVTVMNKCVIDGMTYAIPEQGLSEIGAVVGLGNSADEAIKNCKKNSEGVIGYQLEIDVASLDKAKDIIKKGASYGILL